MNAELQILIIDDDQVDRLSIKRILKKSHLQAKFQEALTLAEGLQKIREFTFDCILSDNNLPDGTGFDLLDTLSAENPQQTPIIILTGDGDELTAVQAFQKGATGYIPKAQLCLDILESGIVRAIKIHQLEKRSQEAEKALIKREAEFRSVLESVPVIIMKLDEHQKITYANLAVNFLGYTPEKLVGKNIRELISQEVDEEMLTQIAAKRIGSRSTTDLEVSMNVCKNSSLYKTQKTVQVLIDSKGLWNVPDTETLKKNNNKKFIGSLVVARNITAQKKIENALRESQKKLRKSNIALEKISNLDGLTEIANRYCFDEFISQELKRAIRSKTPISLIMVDIDYFKKFNDHYGHLAGDDCLKKVATVMKNSLHRSSDHVARYGGEEFVITLPSVNEEGALILAEKMRQHVENLQIEHQDSDVSKNVTISLGIFTIIPNESTTVDLIISKADKALYRAKDQGRNRIVVEHSQD